jgi:hypothetical protein
MWRLNKEKIEEKKGLTKISQIPTNLVSREKYVGFVTVGCRKFCLVGQSLEWDTLFLNEEVHL